MTMIDISSTSSQLTHNPSISEKIYVGIDVGYREHVVAGIPLPKFTSSVHKDYWRRVKTLHFSSDAKGFSKIKKYLSQLSLNPADFLILMEPTGGNYGLNLIVFLLDMGFDVKYVENKAVKDYREKIFSGVTKTDDVDARLMARMAFLHDVVKEEFSIQPVYLVHPDYAEMKTLVADLRNLTKGITQNLNKLQQIVAVTFPELKSFFKSSSSSIVARRLLAEYPTPQCIVEAGIEQVAKVLHEAHGYIHEKRAKELVDLASNSAGLRVIGVHQWRQSWIIRLLESEEQAKKELLEKIINVISQHPYTPFIESLPVKSPIWTSAIIAYISDISRFATSAEFKSYCGLCPRTMQSGTSVHSSSLSKNGVRPLRNAFWQMSLSIISPAFPNSPFREKYYEYVKKGMKPAKALIKIAAKISVVLYQMLKTNKPYDAIRHRKALGIKNNNAVVSEIIPIEVSNDQIEELNDVIMHEEECDIGIDK